MNTGGPAYPLPTIHNPNSGELIWGNDGMTLRDYFAAKAMASLFGPENELSEIRTKNIATDAYLIADAMLKAREEK